VSRPGDICGHTEHTDKGKRSRSMDTARIVKWSRNPSYKGAWIVTVACPLCGRKHTHGIPAGAASGDWGDRVAHCRTGDGGGYLIVGEDGRR
jgi:cytochrome c5